MTFTFLEQNGNPNGAKALMNANYPQYGQIEKTVTFNGGTTNGIGNDGGSQDPYTLFTVTGMVEVSIIAVCTTSLTGATATVAVGTSLNPTGLITTTTATSITNKLIWHNASPNATIELASVVARRLVSDNIILTTGTANVTGGVLKFIVRWAPISADGNIVATP